MNRVAIHSLPSSAAEATRLASLLSLSMHDIDVHRFPDDELRVTTKPAAETTILYATLDRPNDKLIAILLACDALRRQGANRIVLVAPYLCYMRQDTAFQTGEAISQKVIGQLLSNAVDRVVTVDAHLHRTSNIQAVFPNIEADNVSAMPAIADVLRKAAIDATSVVVGPDEESRPWVSELAGRLGLDYAVGQKSRRGDRLVQITFPDSKIFERRPILLVDDIVSSGGTLQTCAKALVVAGAVSIDVVITHALFAPELTGSFMQTGIRSIRSTFSVPHPTNAIPLDGVLAAALGKEATATAVTERGS